MNSIVIAEKSTQAKNIEAAVGNRYGTVMAAQGHLLELEEPEQVNPGWTWRAWSFELLRPEGGYYKTTEPANAPDNAKRKLKAIRDALKTAERVVIATDCDVEGQVIGQELVEHFGFRGEVLRAIFNQEDKKSLIEAFKNLKPNSEYHNLYEAGEARRQADQIYNLTLTRAATKSIKPRDMKGALGIGRVKTATLGMICRREHEISDFSPVDYYQVRVRVLARDGTIQMRHDPERYGEKVKLLDKGAAERIAELAREHSGPVAVSSEQKSKSPPRLLGLPQIQALCGSRHGWPADKTLSVAQSLYETHKVLSYPRADAQYVGENAMENVPGILAGLKQIDQFATLVPGEPITRQGKAGHFCDKCLEGSSHHAIVPNVNTMDDLSDIYPRLSGDEKIVFDLVARNYLAAVSTDWLYEQTVITLDVEGIEFRAVGNVTTSGGWKHVNGAEEDDTEKDNNKGAGSGGEKDETTDLPSVLDGETVVVQESALDSKSTKPPARFNQGSIITAMKNAWKFVEDPVLREQLKESEGIGTNATRGDIVKGLFNQNQIEMRGKHLVATTAGMQIYDLLKDVAPVLVDPATSARWGLMLRAVERGEKRGPEIVTGIADAAEQLMVTLKAHRPPPADHTGTPSPKMIAAAKACARRGKHALPEDWDTDYAVCKTFLDKHMTKGPFPPSEKQVALVNKLIAEGKKAPPKGWEQDAKIVSAWLDKVFGGVKKKKGKKS